MDSGNFTARFQSGERRSALSGSPAGSRDTQQQGRGWAGQAEEPQHRSTESLFGPQSRSRPRCPGVLHMIVPLHHPPALPLACCSLGWSCCTLSAHCVTFQPRYLGSDHPLKPPKTRSQKEAKPFLWKPQQCQGVTGVLPTECPTLSILIMHLLLIRVLESLAVPTVPATGAQG